MSESRKTESLPDRKIPLVDLKAQYHSIKDEIDEAIARVLESGQFIRGQEVEAFEQEFADYCGVKYAIGVGSGTDALYLALLASRVFTVITTPFTFIATLEAIHKSDTKPIFVDIDETFNIDIAQVNQAVDKEVNPSLVAVLPVHLFGQPVDIKHIRHRLIVEDCAHAAGARVGLTTGCFSFYPSKNLGAYGDAGAITTNSIRVVNRVRQLLEHDLDSHVSRLDAIQAAILRVKLKHLDKWIKKRKRIAIIYSNFLEIDYKVEINDDHAYNYFTIRHPDRDGLQKHLASKGIETKVYYRELLAEGDFPVAKKATREVLSLPIYPELTDEQIRYIVNAVNEYG